MPNETPRLETARLILRPPVVDDFERWAEMLADERAARFIGGVQPKAGTWRSMLTMAGAWSLTGAGMFSVIEKATGRWIGRVGPWWPYGWPGSEIGWALHPDAWGKGYAVEAAAATMDYAFDVLGWDDVIHCIDPANAPSQRVATRLGSTHRGPGHLPAPYYDAVVEIWGQTRAQWTALRRALQHESSVGAAGDRAGEGA